MMVRERGQIEAIDSFDCGKRLSVRPSNGPSVRPFEISTVSETTPIPTIDKFKLQSTYLVNCSLDICKR